MWQAYRVLGLTPVWNQVEIQVRAQIIPEPEPLYLVLGSHSFQVSYLAVTALDFDRDSTTTLVGVL